MEISTYIPLIKAVIKTLKELGKSEDISALLMAIEIEEPGVFHDFLIELALTASPSEEIGVGCYSVEHLEKALSEIEEIGATELLNI
jgi:hypothetical protein